MKRLTLTALLAVASLCCHAQKVDIDREYLIFKFRNFPEHPLPQGKNSYSIILKANPSFLALMPNDDIASLIQIEGRRRAADDYGDLQVHVDFKGYSLEPPYVVTKEEPITDQNGKKTGTRIYYYAQSRFVFEGEYQVKTDNNTIDYSGSLNWVDTWRSKDFATSKEAADAGASVADKQRIEIPIKNVKATINSLSRRLSLELGFKSMQEQELFWTLGSKKHPEFTAQSDIFLKLKEAVGQVTEDTVPESSRKIIQAAITYFDEISSRYATEDKGAKKLRYAAHFNKSKLYMLLDDPARAIKEAELLNVTVTMQKIVKS